MQVVTKMRTSHLLVSVLSHGVVVFCIIDVIGSLGSSGSVQGWQAMICEMLGYRRENPE